MQPWGCHQDSETQERLLVQLLKGVHVPAAVSRTHILAGTTQACKTAQKKMLEALGRFALREASRVAKEGSELSVWGANIPELDALVHGCSGNDTVVVFAPVR